MKIAIFLEKWWWMMKLTNVFQKIARRTERDEIDEITNQIIKIVRKYEEHGEIKLSGEIEKFVLSQNEPAKIKNICKKIEDLFSYEKGGKELFLFSTDARLEKDLNEDTISKELKKRFKGKKISLSKNISINKNKEKDDEWVIINKDNKEEFFSVRKEGGKLNFYKELDKRIVFDSFEKKLYATIIGGYVKAAYLFIKDYLDKKSAENCMEESLNSRLLKKIGYPGLEGKWVFTFILERSDFKTGPLLEEDIKAGLYSEYLHEEAERHLKHLLGETGCHGISGERGMGKSTLINKFVAMVKEKIPDSVIIKISMPTKYRDEEFLTALLLKLCNETKKLIKESHPFIIGLLKIPLIAHFLRSIYPNKQVRAYYTIEAIDNDIKYMKTLQIHRGVEYKPFRYGRTSTFKDNPVMYSGPLLSGKLEDTINTVVDVFSKVIFLIDDLDKQKEENIPKILKNLRFLSSVRNCLTIVSVRAGLAYKFKDKDSEIRTLFDDILHLDKLEEDKLIKLIEHRINFSEVGKTFLENILRDYDGFWDTLLDSSEKVPREAIRLFHRSYKDWVDTAVMTLDEALTNNKPKLLRILSATESPKEIIIKYEKGDDIDLKKVNMKIEVNKEETNVFPVAQENKRYIFKFKVNNKMVIDIEKIIGERNDAIKVDGKSTGVKGDNLPGGYLDWKAGNAVKVTLADDQKGEILLEAERTITA